ncbi:MAG: murein biosynthesis integral membrane protein MurJ [Actinomycetota bacterium]|nr:murein biosynthesis integral membrane protein MurJ [Actinomycetota bacterium]
MSTAPSAARATAWMTLGTVFSRITGVGRLAAIAAALGVAETRLADTYNLANTAPNIIYELLLGGILTSVFVPVFVELLEKEGRERAWQVASAILNLSLVVLAAVTILGILLAPLLAKLYALRLEGDQVEHQREALTFLLRLFIPQIVFYALTAITAGLLNAHKRFGAPMYTPILNNLSVIAVFVAFYQLYGKVTLETVTTSQMLLIGLGTTGGVVLMAVAQLPFLRGLGRYRATFDVRHPSVIKLAKLSAFVIAYVVVNQIGYFIVQILANEQQGGYTAYVSAFTFFMLPHGLFAVSVITALLPGMSELAVRSDWTGLRQRIRTGAGATIFLVLPAAVGYLLLAEPIVRLLVEHGVATERSTKLVSDVLRIFVLGLVPFSLFQLFLRAFYSLQDTKTPFLINCGAVALNTALNVPLFHLYGVRGLAAGHACAYAFGALVQGSVLSRRLGGPGRGPALVAGAARTIGAAAGMGVVVWLVSRSVSSLAESGSLAGMATGVAVPVAAGAVSYLLLARAFRVPELQHVTSLVGRRAGRGRR